MRIKELELEEGESVLVILYEKETGLPIHAVTVFALDGKIQISN